VDPAVEEHRAQVAGEHRAALAQSAKIAASPEGPAQVPAGETEHRDRLATAACLLHHPASLAVAGDDHTAVGERFEHAFRITEELEFTEVALTQRSYK